MAASTWTAQLDLGIALANLGSAEEAAEHGKQALASGCGKAMLLPRFRKLDAAFMSLAVSGPLGARCWVLGQAEVADYRVLHLGELVEVPGVQACLGDYCADHLTDPGYPHRGPGRRRTGNRTQAGFSDQR
jgi:hypothetical protein